MVQLNPDTWVSEVIERLQGFEAKARKAGTHWRKLVRSMYSSSV